MFRSLWRSGMKLRRFKFSISCQKNCFADWEASVVSLNFYKRLLDFSQEHIIWDKGVGEFKKFTTSCQIFTIIHSYFLSLLHFCLVHVISSVECQNWCWIKLLLLSAAELYHLGYIQGIIKNQNKHSTPNSSIDALSKWHEPDIKFQILKINKVGKSYHRI